MNKNIVNDTLNLEEDTQKEKYLIFVLDNESYGISINNIIENNRNTANNFSSRAS